MVGKISKNLLKIVLLCFGIILLGIVTTGIVKYNKVIYRLNPIILFVRIIIYIGLIIIFYKKVLPKLEKIKYIEWILFLIFTIISIASALYFKVPPLWDMGEVFDLAREYVETGDFSKIWYLARFPHNTMMYVVEIGVLLLSKTLGIVDYLTTVTIVTALIISSSIVISFYVAKRITNRKNALMFLIICLFTSPLYMYSSIYYTDTFSMPISVLLFYIWLVINDTKSTKRKIILNILFGVVLFIGFELKITSAFIFVAIVLYELVQGNMKKLLKKLLIIVPVAILCICLFNRLVVDKIVPSELRWSDEVPKEHWVMMGMNGVGNFSYIEYAYTDSFENYSQKQQAIRKKIIERLTTRDIATHIENVVLKLGFAWHDGTYWAPDLLDRQPIRKGLLHEFILVKGKYQEYYKYIPQTMHFAMLIFIVINIKRIIKEKHYESKDIIAIITMIGVMMFLIIWENSSRYLMNILPLMLMAQVNGIEYLSRSITKKHSKKIDQK